jgi:hypothetical protein
MALTATEKLSIVRIVGVPLTLLDAQITSLGATYITSVEEAIRAELVRWETAGVDFVSIEPNTANYGVRIDPGAAKRDIIRNLLLLFEMEAATPSNMGTLYV